MTAMFHRCPGTGLDVKNRPGRGAFFLLEQAKPTRRNDSDLSRMKKRSGRE